MSIKEDPLHTLEQIITALKQESSPDHIAKMKRAGIKTSQALGVPIPKIRTLSKRIKPNHELASDLWDTLIHEAKILASLVDRPQWVTSTQMNHWIKQTESWDVCDQLCNNLFRKTSYVDAKINSWTKSSDEFVKRAGFVLIANIAVHDKKREDSKLLYCFPLIEQEAYDPRNFVKKAISWALRQLGKRSLLLHTQALECIRKLRQLDSSSAHWVAHNAEKELTSEKVLSKLQRV